MDRAIGLNDDVELNEAARRVGHLHEEVEGVGVDERVAGGEVETAGSGVSYGVRVEDVATGPVVERPIHTNARPRSGRCCREQHDERCGDCCGTAKTDTRTGILSSSFQGSDRERYEESIPYN